MKSLILSFFAAVCIALLLTACGPPAANNAVANNSNKPATNATNTAGRLQPTPQPPRPR